MGFRQKGEIMLFILLRHISKVLMQVKCPVAHWNYHFAGLCSYQLCHVHIGICVENCFDVFKTADKCAPIPLFKQTKAQSGEILCAQQS